MKYFILGSCATRDIFNYSKEIIVADYFCRSSLISIVSDPLNIPENDIILESVFKKRMVKYDLYKNFFETLQNTEFDFLIIDFIDERLDVLKLGNEYCTRSNELASSGLEKKYNFELIKRFSPDLSPVWSNACTRFIHRLRGILPENKIILNKAFWAKKIFDNDHSYYFDDKYISFIEKHNSLLNNYYNILISLMPGINILEVDEDLRVANKNHVWGLASFHYIDNYYLKAIDKLIAF